MPQPMVLSFVRWTRLSDTQWQPSAVHVLWPRGLGSAGLTCGPRINWQAVASCTACSWLFTGSDEGKVGHISSHLVVRLPLNHKTVVPLNHKTVVSEFPNAERKRIKQQALSKFLCRSLLSHQSKQPYGQAPCRRGLHQGYEYLGWGRVHIFVSHFL